MKGAIKLQNNKLSSAQRYATSVPLLRRIAPREETFSTLSTSSARRRTTVVAQSSLSPKKPEPPIELPPYSYQTLCPLRNVVYAATLHDGKTSLKKMVNSSVLGFDIEWKPNFVKGAPPNPVACVQLSNEDSVIVLQVSAMSKLPEELFTMLQNSSIVKVGVGISDDAKKLNKDWGISVRNMVDLSTLARSLDPYWAEEDRLKAEATNNPNLKAAPVGLARLAARYLTLQLVKGKKVTRSNWERPLTTAQINYAANDAAVAFDVYQRLELFQKGETTLPSADMRHK
ncbi:hypothetical protein M408DRAFT_166951 [Serendipita vermifera MAFF 305830]|uniref:3'-5' exonuclease n=1 Tax=Serendipita vermifera MAFF 305830 TaxID=933852 RepID=A0A0C3B5X3_SERVB|nr:hypothetical protein M408DRAFT_166951 [Serendipita vermifera MAFF 305830]